MGTWCKKYHIEIWAYCLMPNHIHLIAVPQTKEGLQLGISEAHRRYTRMINFRNGWRGHLWQGRFASYPMDESYLLAVARYIECNPSRAKLVKKPWEYQWSSAKAHITGDDDQLVRVAPLLELVDDWQKFLIQLVDKETVNKIKSNESTGRPLGNESFVSELELALDRTLKPKKRGPKIKNIIK